MVPANISMPHPVLGINGDLKDGAFGVFFKIIVDKSARKYVLKDLQINLTNSYLENLRKEGKLTLIIKISCVPTYKTWTFRNPHEIELAENEVDQLLEVESFLIASQKLDNFYDKSFSDIFDDKSFELEEGDIVALTGPKKIVIQKENEKVSLGSIFRFKKISKDADSQEMNFDFDDDQIVINYPVGNSELDPVTLLFDKKQGIPYTALNLYIIPALTEAFRLRSESDAAVHKENKWFTVLETLLPDSEMANEPFINAQKVLKTGIPINMAFEEFITKSQKS